jgi:hypothetical protein
VSQKVGTVDRGLDPGPAQRGTYDMRYSSAGYRPKRSYDRGEHLGRLQRRPALPQVQQKRGADFLR